MRIAQVPPLYESIPPKMYGGTERVVSYLTEELVAQGHDITLFATADAVTNAKVYPVCEQALRLNEACKDPLAWHILQMQAVIEQSRSFDILHFHNDYLHFPFSSLCFYPHITTLHGRLDIPELQPMYRKFSNIPLVSISNSQRVPLPFANWAKTIYHGLPKEQYSLGSGEGGYFAFIGRISPEKRPDRAIEIAKKAGVKLKIAAKVDKADVEYYENTIRPMLDHPLIEFIGEIGEDRKNEFLGNAIALLFPIDWPEPFGMVMIEAMACGTPVIAYNCGSVPEIIDNNETGFIISSVEEALKVTDTLHRFDRAHCREVFDQRFTAGIMAGNYLKVYEQMIDKKQKETGRLYQVKHNQGLQVKQMSKS